MEGTESTRNVLEWKAFFHTKGERRMPRTSQKPEQKLMFGEEVQASLQRIGDAIGEGVSGTVGVATELSRRTTGLAIEIVRDMADSLEFRMLSDAVETQRDLLAGCSSLQMPFYQTKVLKAEKALAAHARREGMDDDAIVEMLGWESREPLLALPEPEVKSEAGKKKR